VLKPCFDFTNTGNCNNPNCKFAHVIRLHGIIDASPEVQNNNNNYNNYNNNNNQKKFHSVTAVANWKTGDQVKIFSGSKDGYWRLWSLANNSFQKEHEQYMGGTVECLQVASNFLFCGFESYSTKLPDVAVGMIHAWDLSNPAAPPMEFHMHPLLPYAHATAVTKLLVDGQRIISGSRDGSIRLWSYDNGRFALVQTLMGHAREVTGLQIVDNNFLWSSSTDASIRIWDLSKNGVCMHAITMKDTSEAPNVPNNQAQPYHTDAVTDLIKFESASGSYILSSSLDGDVKAWRGQTGEMVASEGHGEGVTCMTKAEDPNRNPFLLIGLLSGNIMARNFEPTPHLPNAFSPILLLHNRFSVAHADAVTTVVGGVPGTGTFCSGGMDGKLLVFQVAGDMGLGKQ